MNRAFPLLEVKNTQNGKGLFATASIPAGTVLLKITGKELSFAECVALKENESYCLQVGLTQYVLPDYPFYLSNHSCDPNCGIKDGVNFITIKWVKKGEELQWDYSTSMLERHWTMECKCGTAVCRKQVTDFDLLPTQLKERYIRKGVVMPFILEFLETS
jgi:SET domain-containing protein